MNLVDKLFLAALVVFLPIVFFFTQWFFPPHEQSVLGLVHKQPQISPLNSTDKITAPATDIIKIESLSYATESGLLTVEGLADASLGQISVEVTQKPRTDASDTQIKQASVKGSRQVHFSITPNSNNQFVYGYQLSPKEITEAGIVEIKLTQENLTQSLVYDLAENKLSWK